MPGRDYEAPIKTTDELITEFLNKNPRTLRENDIYLEDGTRIKVIECEINGNLIFVKFETHYEDSGYYDANEVRIELLAYITWAVQHDHNQ